MKISIFSFFSGCGLLDLGFEKAGYEIVFVNEKSESFLNAYQYSRKMINSKIPKYGYYNEDVSNYLNTDTYFDDLFKKEKKKNIVGFIGGPPCPDFSCAGKNKGASGENGKLSKVYFDLIIKEKPDFFMFENVKGLWKTKKHKEFYDKMRKKMQRNGYFIIDKLINSLEYGVPQERERVVMIGFKTCGKEESKTIREAVKKFHWGIAEENTLEIIKNIEWPTQDTFVENMDRIIPEGIIEEITVQYWFNKNNVNRHPNSNEYFIPRQGLAKMQTIEEGDISGKSYKRLHRWRYSPTAAYGNNEVHLHPYLCRRLSVAEVLAIQSAPEDFVLPSNMTLTDKFKTVGNGVPVLMATKIASELKKLLERLNDSKEE